jgi:phage terminase large subunit GpA-like protein
VFCVDATPPVGRPVPRHRFGGNSKSWRIGNGPAQGKENLEETTPSQQRTNLTLSDFGAARARARPWAYLFPSNESAGLDLEYFRQLCSSEIQKWQYTRGQRVPYFETVTEHARNEALDAFVYAMAARQLRQIDVAKTRHWLDSGPDDDCDWLVKPEVYAAALSKEIPEFGPIVHVPEAKQPVAATMPRAIKRRPMHGWSRPY